MARSAEAEGGGHWISIRGNCGELRRFLGARLCAEHQPQRVGTARNSCFTPTLCAVPARCGWSCGHSRAPLLAAPPRCAVSQDVILQNARTFADGQSATQQISNLRYKPARPRRDKTCSSFLRHLLVALLHRCFAREFHAAFVID